MGTPAQAIIAYNAYREEIEKHIKVTRGHGPDFKDLAKPAQLAWVKAIEAAKSVENKSKVRNN